MGSVWLIPKNWLYTRLSGFVLCGLFKRISQFRPRLKHFKMKRVLITLSAVLLIAGFNGCSKDDDGAKLSETLTGKNWKLTAMTINPAINFLGIMISDVYSMMDPCDQDDLIIFNANGVMISDEGPTTCNTGDPQQTTGSWTLSGDEKFLTVISEGDTLTMEVVSFSASKLVGKSTEVADYGTGPQTYTMMSTFQAQ